MKHFFIIANPAKDAGLETAKRIEHFLTQAGCECRVQVRTDAGDAHSMYTNASEIPPQTECILVLGGDGTLIEAARDTIELNIPLLGINLGALGFLAEVEKANIESALPLLIRDEYQIEKRMMLNGQVCRGNGCIESSHALNDIVITRSGSLQIIHFHIYVNGQFLKGYDADGVIIATPTGSTGYSMSAGGPIVEPKAKLIVVTPICPHTLSTRSIVFSAEDEIVIEMVAGKKDIPLQTEANFDGGHIVKLEKGDRIIVTGSDRTTDIVKLNDVSFLEALHKKMSER